MPAERRTNTCKKARGSHASGPRAMVGHRPGPVKTLGGVYFRAGRAWEGAVTEMDEDWPTYAEAITTTWSDAGFWDYLRYDEAGDLWLGGLRVLDAVRRYGTPLEIVDTTVVERRCAEWMGLVHAAARAANYPGRLDFLFAAKANMASEIVSAAYRSGWNAETSAVQDLHNLLWLKQHNLLPPGLRVVCNGFKLPPARYGFPQAHAPSASRVRLPEAVQRDRREPVSYAEEIVNLARGGWHITPILDSEELDFFAQDGRPPMSVGLRLKFGHVATRSELDALVSRFGQNLDAVRRSADRIAATDHLTLTTLHCMVGAAETIPVTELVGSLRLACEIWAVLKQTHPNLTELNMGGGLPPLAEDYDHAGFLRRLFDELLAVSAAAGVPPPDFTFELGSLVAAESGCHVFKVIQDKRNHVDASGGPEDWVIIDGGLMAAIPDMLFLGKPFHFLAVTGANRLPRRARVGDLTCDSDGRYPPKAFGPDACVLLPAGDGEQYLLIQGVGAYQEILAGVRGAHHCGLLEALELILESGPDGHVHGRLMPRQTFREAASLLGYHPDAVAGLTAALAAARGEAG
jgi:diaminopimelate decarboxylase